VTIAGTAVVAVGAGTAPGAVVLVICVALVVVTEAVELEYTKEASVQNVAAAGHCTVPLYPLNETDPAAPLVGQSVHAVFHAATCSRTPSTQRTLRHVCDGYEPDDQPDLINDVVSKQRLSVANVNPKV
jgi:hypothetical protein